MTGAPCRWCGAPAVAEREVVPAQTRSEKQPAGSPVKVLARRAILEPVCATDELAELGEPVEARYS